MYRNFKQVLIVSALGVLSLLSGCSKSDSPATPPVDNTVDVFSKVSTQVFQMDTSQFQLLNQRNFKFLYDADVTVNGNQRATCLIGMSGSSMFLSSPSQMVAQFKFEKINLISVATGSAEICSRYVDALEKKNFFEQPIAGLSENYISFSNLDFSARDAAPEKDFQVDTHHTRVSDFGIRRNNNLQEYFIKPDTTIDVTATVFQELNGTYSLLNDNGTALKMNFSASAVSFSSKPCGFSYEFNNKGAYLQAQGIGLWSMLESKTTQPSSAGVSAECKRWENNVQNLPLKKLEWGALIDSSLQKSVLIRFPSSNPGRDRIEIFN